MNPHPVESTPTPRPWPWRRRIIISAAVMLVVAGALTGILLTRSGGTQHAATPPPGPPSASAPPSAGPPTSGTIGPTATTTAPTGSPAGQPGFPYQPLWPFANPADAAAWQHSYRAGGHQPWHLDADLTALSFTQDYLGYTNVNTVVGTVAAGREDWVSVGFANPNGHPVTAAVLHLARLGTGLDAPWEVVGTRDSTLSLTTPAYGAAVGSPVTVGGRITGVDENLQVQVRELDQQAPVGQVAGIPAGGQNAPWTATVTFSATHASVLTVAVSTGGHIAAVERFAITAVRY